MLCHEIHRREGASFNLLQQGLTCNGYCVHHQDNPWPTLSRTCHLQTKPRYDEKYVVNTKLNTNKMLLNHSGSHTYQRSWPPISWGESLRVILIEREAHIGGGRKEYLYALGKKDFSECMKEKKWLMDGRWGKGCQPEEIPCMYASNWRRFP